MKTRDFKHKKLVIASHNKGKIVEITDLLAPLNIEILSAYDFNLDEPEENGSTFEENALIKYAFVTQKTGLPSISDDSGICFYDLEGDPGIYSARWAGLNKDFNLAMSKINNAIKTAILIDLILLMKLFFFLSIYNYTCNSVVFFITH